MMIRIRTLFVLLGFSVIVTSLCGAVVDAGTISAAQAKNRIGLAETVCGTVASAHYAASSRGRPTFLNLDKPYPHPIFTIVIWGSNRAKFGRPERVYEGKDLCVTGKISEFRGVPEIIASDPAQIKVRQRRSK